MDHHGGWKCGVFGLAKTLTDLDGGLYRAAAVRNRNRMERMLFPGVDYVMFDSQLSE